MNVGICVGVAVGVCALMLVNVCVCVCMGEYCEILSRCVMGMCLCG